MPNIVRFGDITLAEEVVKIQDLGPAEPFKKSAKRTQGDTAYEIKVKSAKHEGADDEEAEAELTAEQDFEAEEFGEDNLHNEQDEQGELNEQDDLHGSEISQGKSEQQGAMQGAAEEIVQSAVAEAARILEQAVREAEQQKADILATVEQEAQQLRAQAEQEGREQGAAQIVDDVNEASKAIQNAIADMEGQRAGFESEYEEQLKWMAVDVASKVLAKKVDDNDAEMAEMVEKAVQSVKSEPWIRIEVAQEMVRLIDRLQSAYEGRPNIEVSAIPAQAGTVQIETPSGMVDASLNTQLANLKEYLQQNSR